MPSAHEAFKTLGPVEWESFAHEDLAKLMTDIFNNAHHLIESIPSPAANADLPEPPSRETEPSDLAKELRKEWKEVKVNPRDNPLALSIYKMAAKDGKGSWFARRSIHHGPSFKKWKRGMEREFAESLKVQGQPGDGKIRGLGADKCVEDQIVDACGKIQVYQLSAQFPGPTTPRDFVTLCLSSDTTYGTSGPRSFMLVSRPCVHPECPQRQGFIRAYYESVEFIREIKIDKTKPSIDAASQDPSTKDDFNSFGEDSATSSPPPRYEQNDDGSKVNGEDSQEEGESIIEWLMITRSDPGGSVPRFMIEKKTPDGIATDASKFFQWISSEKFERLLDSNFESTEVASDIKESVVSTASTSGTRSKSIPTSSTGPKAVLDSKTDEPDFPESPGAGGVYGMISGALGMVASAAASRLLGPTEGNTTESESEISSPDLQDDTSSIHSFHSFDPTVDAELKVAEGEELAPSVSTGAGADSLHSSESTSMRSARHDKELKKLEERRRKTEEKLRRAEERALAKKNDDSQRDQLALQKLQEKHEREIAKQEEKYQRERRKLEEKRANEEKKAEERRRKQAEREQKANLALELDKTRTERDIARKEIEILAEQVRQLQAMNTKLVARLGREGIALDDTLTPGSGGPGNLSQSVTEQDLVKQSNGVKS